MVNICSMQSRVSCSPQAVFSPEKLSTRCNQMLRCPTSSSCTIARQNVHLHSTRIGVSDPYFRHLMFSTSCRKKKYVRQVFPFDLAWDVDAQKLASNLFATSIIPYAGFLYHLQKSRKAPKLMLFGFYFLLVFVLATIIAGIYAKLHYHSILANVDWLHGSAESFLTITNLLIVLGLREGIRDAEKSRRADAAVLAEPDEASPD